VITISTPDREFSINFNQMNGLSQYQVEYLVDEIQKYKRQLRRHKLTNEHRPTQRAATVLIDKGVA